MENIDINDLQKFASFKIAGEKFNIGDWIVSHNPSSEVLYGKVINILNNGSYKVMVYGENERQPNLQSTSGWYNLESIDENSIPENIKMKIEKKINGI